MPKSHIEKSHFVSMPSKTLQRKIHRLPVKAVGALAFTVQYPYLILVRC